MRAIVNWHVICRSSRIGLLCCAVFDVGLAACPHNEDYVTHPWKQGVALKCDQSCQLEQADYRDTDTAGKEVSAWHRIGLSMLLTNAS